MEDNYFTILWCFPVYQHESFLNIHVSPPFWTPPPPTPPYPSRLSQSTSFVCPTSCIRLSLVIVLHMVIYMFQCYSIKSPHPLLPLSPKVSSLLLCLLCCPVHKIIIFLDSIHICWYTVFVFSLSDLTSLCVIGSRFNHFLRTDSNVLLFIVESIFHYVYVPQLPYPFIYWWTARLLPCPSYFK